MLHELATTLRALIGGLLMSDHIPSLETMRGAPFIFSVARREDKATGAPGSRETSTYTLWIMLMCSEKNILPLMLWKHQPSHLMFWLLSHLEHWWVVFILQTKHLPWCWKVIFVPSFPSLPSCMLQISQCIWAELIHKTVAAIKVFDLLENLDSIDNLLRGTHVPYHSIPS